MEDWKIIYEEYSPKREKVQEALCTLGNGYLAIRGAAEESQAGKYHYPGTYFAGGYNRLESEVKNRKIENEDLVNWPNWLPLNFKPESGDWLDLDNMLIKKYQKELDMKNGVLRREFVVEDSQKRQTSIVSERFVHMQYKHLAGIRWQLTPLNWSGNISVKTAIDGSVINNGVPRYRALNGKHLQPKGTENFGKDGILLKTATVQSCIHAAIAARTYVHHSQEVRVSRELQQSEEYIEEQLTFEVQKKQTYGIEKIVAFYNSKDMAISQPSFEARNAVLRAPSFDKLLKQQSISWRAYWQRCDIEIESGQEKDQKLLRLHIFHSLQTNSMNSIDLDVGVPSRGWHGEAYRGHILWDELFIFPFLNLSVPEITRSLLMYRYRRLPEARAAAKDNGYEGAMYPWQSGSNGREESQEIHLNPESGHWIPDDTHLQRHVNAAIAYNVWQYYQITQDDEFMSFFGAEMLLDIARFWASKTTYNAERERYEIHGVVGPDEYHVSYPNADKPGLNNNAYTNVMVAWLLNVACQTVDLLDDTRKNELLEKLEIDCDEFDIWRNISKKMFVPFNEDGIISQYEDFENLKELDWEKYHEEYGEILRLDRILEKEGDSPDNYKASKQADVLMLFYLFSHEELGEIFHRLGYDFTSEQIPDNIQYYEKRTSHGSTLSKLVHSWVMARENRQQSWHSFEKALISDFEDIQGGTTEEGIHLGAMAGTLDLIQRCYTGLDYRENSLWFSPRLPEKLKKLRFRIRYRSRWICIELTHQQLELSCDGGASKDIQVVVNGKTHTFKKGEVRQFKLEKEEKEDA